jgi:signal transduction histidine kinase
VLEVVNKRQLPWTMDDRDNLSVLATEAAVAIEVAQLVVNLQRANEELSEVDKLKNDFIAIASHELRTPLGIIMGYASFLQDSEDEATSGHASKVMDSALQLRRIIEDMINLRQLKQKPHNLLRERLPLGMLIDDLQRDVLTLAGAGQHDLKLDCVDPEAAVLVDRSRISMALVNVLNNAFTFTPQGGKIRVRAHVPNEREAWISISDSGIGLEEGELERIFDEFYQVEDHMTRHRGGLGIGLSIARALVRAHGGRIWASSPGLGQGATFTIALPLAGDKGS